MKQKKKNISSDADKEARRRKRIEAILNALGALLESLSSKQLSLLAKDEKLPFSLKEVAKKRAIKLEREEARRQMEESGEIEVLFKPSLLKSRYDKKP
jgi:hypothetical protein